MSELGDACQLRSIENLFWFKAHIEKVCIVPLQVEAAMRKWSNAYVYGMLGTDVATVGTVDMWLYRCRGFR